MKRSLSLAGIILSLAVLLSSCTIRYYRPNGTPVGEIPPAQPAVVYYHYWYYPATQVYFDESNQYYYYRSRGRWWKVRHVPYDLSRGARVMIDTNSARPYQDFEKHREQYPRNWANQGEFNNNKQDFRQDNGRHERSDSGNSWGQEKRWQKATPGPGNDGKNWVAPGNGNNVSPGNGQDRGLKNGQFDRRNQNAQGRFQAGSSGQAVGQDKTKWPNGNPGAGNQGQAQSGSNGRAVGQGKTKGPSGGAITAGHGQAQAGSKNQAVGQDQGKTKDQSAGQGKQADDQGKGKDQSAGNPAAGNGDQGKDQSKGSSDQGQQNATPVPQSSGNHNGQSAQQQTGP